MRYDLDNDTYVAGPLTRRYGKGINTTMDDGAMIAAPLSHGSNPNSNMAGRRREDDENLVTAFHAIGDEGDPAFTLSSTSPGAVGAASVRRLTPTECERLQGFPDGWTRIPWYSKWKPKDDYDPVAEGRKRETWASDSARYAALGDAVTVNVAHWIGARIMRAAA